MSYRNQSEAAMAAYLQGKVGVPVLVGLRDEIKTMPCVVVSFVSAQENPPDSGNMDIQMQIMVQSQIDEEGAPGALDVHEATVSEIDMALGSELLPGINQAGDFFHYFGKQEQSGPDRELQDMVVSEMFTVTFAAALGDF